MKVMIRKNAAGVLSAYVSKKDQEEPIVSMEKKEMWGGIVTLANGWQLELPPMAAATALPLNGCTRRCGAWRRSERDGQPARCFTHVAREAGASIFPRDGAVAGAGPSGLGAGAA